MKQIKLYSKDIVRVCKYALVSMMFFMGVIPALAQDESEIAVEDAPTAQVKKIKKPVKNYPMKEVKGKVVDAATGEPLAGVQIKSYNNSFYTAMTNEEGVYTIKVPTFITSLEATLQGYNKVRTAINDRSESVDIQLLTERYLPDYELVTRGSKKVGITRCSQHFPFCAQCTGFSHVHQRSQFPQFQCTAFDCARRSGLRHALR